MAEDENSSRGSDENAKETNERTGKAKVVVVAGVAVVQRLWEYFRVNLHRGHPDKEQLRFWPDNRPLSVAEDVALQPTTLVVWRMRFNAGVVRAGRAYPEYGCPGCGHYNSVARVAC